MKTKILEQLKQRPMRAWAIACSIGAEEREIGKCLQYLRKVGLVRFDKNVGWVMAQNKDETALYADAADREKARAESAEARVRELEATDRIPADVEKRNTWAKRIVDERDAAQEAAGSAERRLGELEAEMKECSEVRAKLAVDLAEYQLRAPKLESQCAAMREALDDAVRWIAGPQRDDFAAELKTCRSALSGDAGRALLERVEALEKVVAEVRRMEASFLMVLPDLVQAVVDLDALEAKR